MSGETIQPQEFTIEAFGTLPQKFFLAIDTKIASVSAASLQTKKGTSWTSYYLEFGEDEQKYGVDVQAVRKNGEHDYLIIRHPISGIPPESFQMVSEKLNDWWKQNKHSLIHLISPRHNDKIVVCSAFHLNDVSGPSLQNLIRHFIEVVPEIEEKAREISQSV